MALIPNDCKYHDIIKNTTPTEMSSFLVILAKMFLEVNFLRLYMLQFRKNCNRPVNIGSICQILVLLSKGQNCGNLGVKVIKVIIY